jgi:hypothetical protein
MAMASVPNLAQRGTAASGTVTSSVPGYFHVSGYHGLANAWYYGYRKTVIHTVTFDTTYDELPEAWVRSQGTVGWPYIPSEGEFVYDYDDPGFAEVIALTETSVTLRTYCYELYHGNYEDVIDTFPRVAAVAMSYTAVGLAAVTGVPEAAAPTPSLTLNPNPASSMVRIALNGGVPGSTPEVGIFPLSGQLIRRLEVPRGGLEWNVRDADNREIPSGVYFVRSVKGRGDVQGKILILR